MSNYVMGRTTEEYERLRRQAEVWAPATARLLDRAGLSPGDRCLDVGCGTGAVMELMAARKGVVTGIDVDATLGAAVTDLFARTSASAGSDVSGDASAGSDVSGDASARTDVQGGASVQASALIRADVFVQADVEKDDDAVPAGAFDLVYGRLILLHVADPVAVLRRMWRWVAPGGVLVVQDYDMRAVDSYPPLAVVDEWRRVFLGAYAAAGRDVRLGLRLPTLFAEAGIGAPDSTDVTGRLGTTGDSAPMLAATYRSIAPLAIAKNLITETQRDEWLSEIDTAARVYGDHTAMWPLLLGAIKQKLGS